MLAAALSDYHATVSAPRGTHGLWTDQQHEYISKGLAQPLLMTEWDDLELPFINEIAQSGILTDMVTDVLVNDKTPLKAAINAQKKAEKLIESLGYKKW